MASVVCFMLLNVTVLTFAVQIVFYSLSSLGFVYYRPDPMVLFEDEFESGDFNCWNGTSFSNGNLSVLQVNPYEGSFHGYFETNAINFGVNHAYSYVDFVREVSEVFARGYFYIYEGLPLDDNGDRFGLIAYEIGGRLQTTFRVYRSGGIDKFDVVGFNGSQVIHKSTTDVYPIEGRWYCIEFYIKIHPTKGEYRVWINGIERISILGVNTANFGNYVGRVRFGLTSSVNTQHKIVVFCDSVTISTRYVGQLRYTFGIVGSIEENPSINNFCWLFGNQSISYRVISPSEVEHFMDVNRFDGVIVWTKSGGYNATAIREYANTRLVISDMWDFCNVLYPSLSDGYQVAYAYNITYDVNWGNFRNGDVVYIRNESGDNNFLQSVLLSKLDEFSNVTVIARYDVSRAAILRMNGIYPNSGYFVMDLDATTPETEWAGIWHVFPAIKMVQDFPTGKNARWMGLGDKWRRYEWILNYLDSLVETGGNITEKWVIGRSVEGRNITAIVIGKGSKNIIIDACIHGNEKTVAFTALRIAELIINYYQNDSWWKSKLKNDWRIIIIPVLNPDGFVHNTRKNANGVDLNRQFPPGATTTEPEAWALRWLMGNYTPTVYVNLHTGYYWYPNWMIYGNYESGENETLTINALKAANETFVSLKHWGWFDEKDKHIWIGKVNAIAKGGINSMAIAYASYQYGASCLLLESFVWSSSYGAKQSLWAMDYYCSIVLAFLQNNKRLQ